MHLTLHGNAQDSVELDGVVHGVPVVGVCGYDGELDEQVERERCVQTDNQEREDEETDEARGCGVAGSDEAVEFAAVAVEAVNE